jgi:hypothetical protein
MSSLEGNVAFATDMTLVLGAESYILKNKNNFLPSDPFGRKSLQAFIDLFLNAEKMYFTLPGTQDTGAPILIKQLGTHLNKFSKGAVQLSQQTEELVFKSFVELIASNNIASLGILEEWLKFQMLNPIVTEGHRYRVHEKGERLIPEDSYQIWNEESTRLLQGKLNPLQSHLRDSTKKFNNEVNNYLHIELSRFSSLEDFLLCYLFDNYRRGWQYIEGVKAAGDAEGIEAVYFPHALRNHALNSSTANWQDIQLKQNQLWSWGGYIVELLNEPEYEQERSPEKVVEYILAIHEAMDKTGCPRWDYEDIFDRNGKIKNKKYLKKLHTYVEETANRAKLPLLRLQESEATLIEKLAHLAVRFVSPALVIDPKSEMRLRRLARNIPFYKGNFGYRGLLPNDIDDNSRIGSI